MPKLQPYQRKKCKNCKHPIIKTDTGKWEHLLYGTQYHKGKQRQLPTIMSYNTCPDCLDCKKPQPKDVHIQ